MSRRASCRRRWSGCGVVVVAVAALMLASQAAGISSPAPVSVAPGTPSAQTTFTFSWTAPGDAAPGNIVTFRGGVDGADGDLGAGTSVTQAVAGAGAHTFSVRAVEFDPLTVTVVGESAPATQTVVVDLTPPTIRGTIAPATPNGRNGWYNSATITWTCADPGGTGVASCPAADVLDVSRAERDQGDATNNIQSPRLTIPRTARDRVGLTASASVGPIRFDALAPTAGQPKQPGVDARIAAEPTYRWSRAGKDTSGVERYEVWVEEPLRAPRIVATVAHVDGRSEFSATRTTALPLNPLLKVTWYVRSYDVAGNARNSTRRSFTIDPTVPPAPTIGEGPVGPTRVTAPTFAWSGAAGATFTWDLTLVGVDATRVVQKGTGLATRVALGALADGDYVFRVTQLSGVGVVSEEATRNFEVDTTVPAPPAITGRPSDGAGAFSWSTEPGASSRWTVTSGGVAIAPAAETPSTSASVVGLAAGQYGFSVQQVDAAGNVSAPASELFSIATSAVAATPTPVVVRGAVILPHSNASKLHPRAGVTVRTRTPVLRWARGPVGTKLYNIQLFKAARGAAGRVTAVRKVLSAFPRRRAFTVPAAKLSPGTCYVWRVWPYKGRGFTRTPLGVSNFCVASARVLAAAARARSRNR